MKVYVCFIQWSYEGCSEPLVVFKSEDKAARWCEENKKPSVGVFTDYVELELNDDE